MPRFTRDRIKSPGAPGDGTKGIGQAFRLSDAPPTAKAVCGFLGHYPNRLWQIDIMREVTCPEEVASGL